MFYCVIIGFCSKGLDTGEVTPEDLEKLKLLVPKAFEDFVVRKCIKLFRVNIVA